MKIYEDEDPHKYFIKLGGYFKTQIHNKSKFIDSINETFGKYSAIRAEIYKQLWLTGYFHKRVDHFGEVYVIDRDAYEAFKKSIDKEI
jgi:hypothetical protein